MHDEHAVCHMLSDLSALARQVSNAVAHNVTHAGALRPEQLCYAAFLGYRLHVMSDYDAAEAPLQQVFEYGPGTTGEAITDDAFEANRPFYEYVVRIRHKPSGRVRGWILWHDEKSTLHEAPGFNPKPLIGWDEVAWLFFTDPGPDSTPPLADIEFVDSHMLEEAVHQANVLALMLWQGVGRQGLPVPAQWRQLTPEEEAAAETKVVTLAPRTKSIV